MFSKGPETWHLLICQSAMVLSVLLALSGPTCDAAAAKDKVGLATLYPGDKGISSRDPQYGAAAKFRDERGHQRNYM